MNKNSNITRLYILIGLTIAATIFCILSLIPNSPFVEQNICMDTEKASAEYAKKDIVARKKFIIKRNEHCKLIMQNLKEPQTVYEQLDACAFLDSAIDAAEHYYEINGNKHEILSEIKLYEKHLENVNYCPQIGEISKRLAATKAKYQK